MNEQPSLRFDHREIAVIFSLFIFVSLLMFTVGILVGKGLAQAKYESGMYTESRPARSPASTPETKDIGETKETPGAASVATTEAKPVIEAPAPVKTEKIASTPPLKLIPENPVPPDVGAGSLQEPMRDREAENLLRNPKIRSLLESEKRAPGSTSPKAAAIDKQYPPSFAQGKFTVQIGSYPNQKGAEERVNTLKKLGFPYAYFSAKEMGDKKDKWYRVRLGFFPDVLSAENSGRLLQEHGEVKSYLVRKTDAAD